ncbi:hypothetical protein FJT64_014674 [Amphibalanus amphitrite]|uniref:Uncharacterized protein n=1 Tax=Amphibalanus amphitrite TaxID=1232801 RepID=A0A6A4UZQ4_AMPAM|nr:hypothetical protein FJT64_014674 [Amphibalanus amphitrite]
MFLETSIKDYTTIDDQYAAFLEIWNAAVDLHCPLKRVRLRHPDRPWLTLNDDMMQLQARRDAARRKRDAHRTPTSDQEYSSLKKEFRRRIAAARAEYFSAPASVKELWAELRKHALGNKPSAGLDDVPDDAAANRFNTYFAEVGHRIAEELAGRRDGTALPPRPPTVCSSAFTVRPATLSELSGALKRMSGKNLRYANYDDEWDIKWRVDVPDRDPLELTPDTEVRTRVPL